MYQTTIYSGLEGLAMLSDEWAVLLACVSQPRFFHYYGWWRSYVTSLVANPADFLLVVVREAARAVAIVPLERRRRRILGSTVRMFALPQHDHLPLGDIVCRADVSADALVTSINRALEAHGGWDVLEFLRVLDGSSVARLLSGGPMCVTTVPYPCYYLDCARPYETIVSGFSRNFRSNLNKARNKLKREADVDFQAVTEAGALRGAFGEFLRIESSGWKGRAGQGTAIELHPTLVKFYETLMDELGPQGNIVINLLRVGKRAIAAQFCTKDADTLYVLKLAYDEEWARLAPGNMLLEWVIQGAGAGAGFRYLNMVNDPPWFADWCPQSVPICNVRRYNSTAKGVALVTASRAKRWVKPVYVECRERLARWRAGASAAR